MRDIVGYLGHEDDIRAAGDAGAEREPTGAMPMTSQ